jgi:hypothetical protein
VTPEARYPRQSFEGNNMPDDTRDTEDCARRAAKRVGLAIRKSRAPTLHDNNHGHFMLFDPIDNQKRYDMTAQDVIDWCDVEAQR